MFFTGDLYFIFVFVKDYIYPGVEVVSLGFIKRTSVLDMGWGGQRHRCALAPSPRNPRSEGCRTVYTRHLPPQKRRSHGCGFFPETLRPPRESWSFLGWSGSRNSSPPQPRPGPLRLSASRAYARTLVFVWFKGSTASRPRSSPGAGIRVTVEVPTELRDFHPTSTVSP